ncbi:MAG: hypothetical protein OXC83_07120 [Chloroflexi bacterium]|nr:hypothetical protein [Chloroflexota bacterium]
MSKLGLIVVSVVMVVLLACSAPEPTPTSTPVPTPTPRPTPTPEPVVVCVPEVVDYVTEMADEVETVIEAGKELDALLEDRSDDLVWRARVAKELLDMGGAVNTIASTAPPEPFPTVYEAIKIIATDFERIIESADAASGEAADIALQEAIKMLMQAISDAVKSQDLIVEWLGGCNN